MRRCSFRLAALTLACATIGAADAGAHELVVAGPSAVQLARQGLHVIAAVFAGHREWNVWSVQTNWSPARVRRVSGVRWVETDGLISRSAPNSSAARSRASRRRALATGLPSARARSALAPPAPPSTCSLRSGLDAGQPNDPGFCNEPLGPFYAEQWNLFCFLPATQSASVAASASNPPRASGICASGAWRLGAQGQGTVIAILDSGVDYLHPDLRYQMVDETSDPLLRDPRFPGRASDGHIHGWNFYDSNAEPMDYYGHGTGRAGIAAAQADNGVGIAGVAPKAKLMAVKVGDTYVVHAENLAEGVVYAVDHGADAINTSLGATGNSRLLRLAAQYADSKGVFWAAATANEYSTHHNYPTNLDTVAGSGGINPMPAPDQLQIHNTPAPPVLTFLQKTNYSNYGGILDFSTPTDTPETVAAAEACHGDPLVGGKCAGKGGYGLHASGTSTATPEVAGAAALVRSAGFDAGFCRGHLNIGGALPSSCSAPVLDANELRQLLAYTATRIISGDNYPSVSGSDPSLGGSGPFYPQQPADPHLGWSMWTGYGRIDAYAAAAYARAGLIPPAVQLYGDTAPQTRAFRGLTGPQRFALLDPARTPTVPIVGHIAAPHAAGRTLSWRVQLAPCLEPQERDFSDIASGTGAKDGTLARWRLPTGTAAQCANAGGLHPFSPRGTYTVRVVATLAGNVADPVAANDPNGAPGPAPLIGQDRRVVYVRPADHDAPGSPVRTGTGGEGSATLYDLEGRGQLDTILGTADGTVIALRPNGRPVPGWPVHVDPVPGHRQAVAGQDPRGQIVGSVAVGDIDGDHDPEVVAMSLHGGVYAWYQNGRRAHGFPVALPPGPSRSAPRGGQPPGTSGDYCLRPHPALYGQRYSDYGSIAAPVLADLKRNGQLDIVAAAGNQCVYALDGAGRLLWASSPNATASDTTKIAGTPAVGDLTGDGKPDVVVGTEEVAGSIPSTSGRLYVLDGRSGRIKPGWPVSLPSLAASGVPTVASGVISSPALFPPPGGGKGLQIAAGVFLGGDPGNPVRTLNADGTPAATLNLSAGGSGSNTTDFPMHWGISQVAVGALGGTREAIVTGTLGTFLAADTAADPSKKPQFQHAVAAFDAASGAPLASFPRQIEDWQFLAGPAIADVKGDGSHQVIEGSGGGYLHAFDPAGTSGAQANFSTSLSPYRDFSEPAGFPVFEGGGYITSTPTVGQLRRRGPVTVVSLTRDGYLFMTQTRGRPQANDQWWHFHHDERNTGVYGLDTRPPATITDLHARRQGSRTTLAWTAVGDDWWIGRAARYELFWSRRAIRTQQDLRIAHPVRGVPTPRASGTRQSVVVRGLPRNGRLYFAIRAIDRARNMGLLGGG